MPLSSSLITSPTCKPNSKNDASTAGETDDNLRQIGSSSLLVCRLLQFISRVSFGIPPGSIFYGIKEIFELRTKEGDKKADSVNARKLQKRRVKARREQSQGSRSSPTRLRVAAPDIHSIIVWKKDWPLLPTRPSRLDTVTFLQIPFAPALHGQTPLQQHENMEKEEPKCD